jgi:integrase
MRGLCERISIPPATTHDLRRTAATLMATAGTPRIVLKLILNHADNEVTGRYDRNLYEPEKREAINKLDAMIQDAVNAIRVHYPAEAGRPMIQIP